MSQVVRVVPDVPSFAVDDGFAYSVPDPLGHVALGSIVRVPLSGRSVRGYVVDDNASTDRKLRPIKGRTGDVAIFDHALLETLRWTAIHYVAPLGAILSKAAPPNVPKRAGRPLEGPTPTLEPALPDVTRSAAGGGRIPPHALIGAGPWAGPIAALASAVLAAGRNVAVIAPTVHEVTHLAEQMPFGDRTFVASSQLPARATTTAWVTAQINGGVLVIGTGEIALWPMGDLGLVIVVEPGRRALKAPQTPTLRVGDIMRRRAAVEGFGLVYAGPVPPSEVVAAGTKLARGAGRVWPRVEVVDRRRSEASGMVTATTRQALNSLSARGGEAFVFVPRRREYLVCSTCGEPRRCAQCGSGISREPECVRCGARSEACSSCGGATFRSVGLDVKRVVADLGRSMESVGVSGSGALVQVGTERDLVDRSPVDLAVVVGLDSMVLSPNYRAGEEALRIGARVAGLVRPGGGRRCIVETAMPDDEIVKALVAGRPDDAMNALVAARGVAGFPPTTELIALDISGPAMERERLTELQSEGATVLGPAPSPTGSRWLIQGSDLRRFRLGLRSSVHEWREQGRRVRIDVDPIDL